MPIALIALIVPPLITEANDFADKVPELRARRDAVREGEQARCARSTATTTSPSKLEEEAGKLPNRLGGAAGTLRDVGFGIVNSRSPLITILVLTAFLLGNGRTWVDA